MQFKTLAVLFTTLLATATAAPLDARGGTPPPTCTFGQYSCATAYNGIQQCGYGANGLELLQIGLCPPTTHCGYIGTIPYCLNN